MAPMAYHTRYELRNPMSHLPTKYAENSIRYCLIRQPNSQVTWASTVEIKNMVFTTPYPRFKSSIRNKIIDSYKEQCVKITEDCFVCARLRLIEISNLIESLRISLDTGIH